MFYEDFTDHVQIIDKKKKQYKCDFYFKTENESKL